MSWSFDSGDVAFDSGQFTFDGGINQINGVSLPVTVPESAVPYLNLITSEHNQKPNFMGLVGILTGALGDATAATESIVPAFSLNGGAAGAQLDILGLWIGQSRIIPNVLVPGFFGFSDLRTGVAEGLQLQFGDLRSKAIGGAFFGLQDTAVGTTVLSDVAYLTALRARITRNQSVGTLQALEQALLFIFGVGCSVADVGNLKLSITVSQPVSPLDQALISSLDILPRPAGIPITSITYQP